MIIYIIYRSNNKKNVFLGLLLGKHFFIVNKFPHGAAPVILLLFSTAVAALIAIDLRGGEKRGLFISPTGQPRATAPHEYVTIFQTKKNKIFLLVCGCVCVYSISKNCPLTRHCRNAIGNLYKMCARACSSALQPGKVGATLIKRGILDFIFIAVLCVRVCCARSLYFIIYTIMLCASVHFVFRHVIIYF